MTLTKSILLGSAAGIMMVAGAQAADLPTRKAAPAEYVKVCNVGGMAGFIIPGSDTCLKISGYITAQFVAGNVKDGFGGTYSGASVVQTGNPNPIVPGAMLGALNPAVGRDAIGYSTRVNISFDARQDTAYGVLRGYTDLQIEAGNGLDNVNTLGYINHAYVQWAGITAGKANSFFSFFGGGEAWANIFSPDRQGFNQPDLFAYTATFGGGFSASISFESQEAMAGAGGIWGGDSNLLTGAGGYTYLGNRVPDIVGALHVDQGWGSAQVSGVLHRVNVASTADGSREDVWGYGILGGVTFKLPTFGAGDSISLQGEYTKNAIWYSGIPDGMWGEYGQVNGNGIAMPTGDTYYTGLGNWATPTAWSITATAEHHFSPAFSLDPEISYVSLHWSGAAGNISTNSTSWIGGIVAHWDPVPHLDFEFELLYQTTHQSTPGLYVAAANGGIAFPSTSDGFAGRFEITRDF
jgi:hypothetical protein